MNSISSSQGHYYIQLSVQLYCRENSNVIYYQLRRENKLKLSLRILLLILLPKHFQKFSTYQCQILIAILTFSILVGHLDTMALTTLLKVADNSHVTQNELFIHPSACRSLGNQDPASEGRIRRCTSSSSYRRIRWYHSEIFSCFLWPRANGCTLENVSCHVQYAYDYCIPWNS